MSGKHTGRVACLLFGSGLCALIYQAVWFREFRLIFGASTAANAAVLGLFMGGLGLGSALLAGRAQRTRRPLVMYAHLEIGIALGAALSPVILLLVQKLYFLTGGIPSLGIFAGTGLRLLLAAIVMGIPAFLMGGTLPAAVRAVVSQGDTGRRGLSILYGVNTLGAVTGVFLSTFFLIELLGNHRTLLLAAVLNLGVAIVAWRMGRNMGLPDGQVLEQTGPAPAPQSMVSPMVVYIAAALVGFCFFLLELVWYRVLGSVLGGSTFTFGIILIMALLGIGLGGTIHGMLGSGRQATPGIFAFTCGLEALFVMVPVILGDRIAVLAGLLRGLHTFGFWGNVMGWATIAALVILPTAFIAGIQFPMLISLLGRGGQSIAQQTGRTYAWNTVGAITGSLAGGFGLLPLLTAPVAWKLVAGVLGALALFIALLEMRRLGGRSLPAAMAILVVSISCFGFAAQGPSAFWRHSPVGAGRLRLLDKTWNEVRETENYYRSALIWEKEGVESSVGLLGSDGLAFVVNGKVDGSSMLDKGTQIMSGMLPALLHGDVKRACVVGLGTGSTAGWLGSIPSMERVMVVELEPALDHIALLCAPVNQAVMDNPKVDIHYNDAREVITTSKEKFDLVVSEPSNPYRAGIASLFTKEYYLACKRIMNEDAVFAQWLQAYEVDSRTVRIVYRTLRQVFPSVETFMTQTGDLLLVCRNKATPIDVEKLEALAQQEPYRSALMQAWKGEGANAVLARFIIGGEFADVIHNAAVDPINTDDKTVLEYAFARTAGDASRFSYSEMLDLGRTRGWHRPSLATGDPAPDWNIIDQLALNPLVAFGTLSDPGTLFTERDVLQYRILSAWFDRQWEVIINAWRNGKWKPASALEQILLTEALGVKQAPEFAAELEKVSEKTPHEALYLQAVHALYAGDYPRSLEHFKAYFVRARVDPWCWMGIQKRALSEVLDLSAQAKNSIIDQQLLDLISQPFVLNSLEFERRRIALTLASRLPLPERTTTMARLIEGQEPWIPWTSGFLRVRMDTYEAVNHPKLPDAVIDFVEFESFEPKPLGRGLHETK